MTKITPAPLYEPVVDESKIATLPWTLFFNSLFTGDTGTAWTPTFVGLTEVGTPTITGKYYKISQSLVYFSILITPATSTSSVVGSTYIQNFPLTIKGSGICFALANNSGTNSGMANSANNFIYAPAWTTVTTPVTVVGMCEI